MQYVPVQSTNLRSVAYDEAESVLGVVFQSGAIYAYQGVPKTVYEGLLVASSTGSYFHRMVKQAGYSFKLVQEAK